MELLKVLFSSNKKAIDWKTVGLGLVLQLLIAIGVLKIGFIQSGFEFVGSLFVKVLDFTRAGSKFLFEGLVVDMDKFGFIFAFQVLPTIIFFSALTSLLFYLGIIQFIVRGFGILLSKSLKISGAESLSVAGNIFLGQTEAPLLIKAYLEKMNRYAWWQAKDYDKKTGKLSPYHFIIKPFWGFFKHYIVQGGFRDGVVGLAIGYIQGYVIFMRYIKLWLLRKNRH